MNMHTFKRTSQGCARFRCPCIPHQDVLVYSWLQLPADLERGRPLSWMAQLLGFLPACTSFELNFWAPGSQRSPGLSSPGIWRMNQCIVYARSHPLPAFQISFLKWDHIRSHLLFALLTCLYCRNAFKSLNVLPEALLACPIYCGMCLFIYVTVDKHLLCLNLFP